MTSTAFPTDTCVTEARIARTALMNFSVVSSSHVVTSTVFPTDTCVTEATDSQFTCKWQALHSLQTRVWRKPQTASSHISDKHCFPYRHVCNGSKDCRCCIADLPPCRPSPGRSARPSPRKICNIANLPPEDLQCCRPSPEGLPRGKVCHIAELPPFIADLPRGKICNIADRPPFFKVPDSLFSDY